MSEYVVSIFYYAEFLNNIHIVSRIHINNLSSTFIDYTRNCFPTIVIFDFVICCILKSDSSYLIAIMMGLILCLSEDLCLWLKLFGY